MKTAAAPRPRQQRSQHTCDRIVAAARTLLQDRLFEELSVHEIAARAGASVGSFYNLFADKEALLPELYRRHCAELLDRLDAFCDASRWRDAALVDIARALVHEIAAMHRAERGLLRALVLRAHVRPRARAAERSPAMDAVLPRLARLLASHAGGRGHPHPQRAAALGLLSVLATVRECMLYPDTTAHVLRISESVLEKELTRMLLRYLEAG